MRRPSGGHPGDNIDERVCSLRHNENDFIPGGGKLERDVPKVGKKNGTKSASNAPGEAHDLRRVDCEKPEDQHPPNLRGCSRAFSFVFGTTCRAGARYFAAWG